MGQTPRDRKPELDGEPEVDGNALIFQGGSAVGRYALESLSASGARIQSSNGLRPGHLVHLLVQLESTDRPLSLTGSVHRVRDATDEPSVTVHFRVLSADQEDAIQDALLRSLLRRNSLRTRLPFLVFEPRRRVCDEIESELRSFCMPVRCVDTLEELISELESDDAQYAAVVVHSAMHDRGAMEVLEFFARTEGLKTIVLPEPDGSVGTPASRLASLPHTCVATQWSRSEFRAAVRIVLSN